MIQSFILSAQTLRPYVLSGSQEALRIWSSDCLLMTTLQGLEIPQQSPFWSHCLLSSFTTGTSGRVRQHSCTTEDGNVRTDKEESKNHIPLLPRGGEESILWALPPEGGFTSRILMAASFPMLFPTLRQADYSVWWIRLMTQASILQSDIFLI